MPTQPSGMSSHRVLLLPGWMNSGEDHWQSHWERSHGDLRVVQGDWEWPRRGDWMARLEEVVLQDDVPALLVAHSLGCHLVAAWASHSRNAARVKAAMLVAPADIEREDAPLPLATWRPIVRARLPFASLAVVSDDDPYASPEQAARMAADWGSELASVGACGHINGQSGLGGWPAGRAMLQALAAANL